MGREGEKETREEKKGRKREGRKCRVPPPNSEQI